MTKNALILRGARANNLKALDLEIEHDKLIAITGVSGSGKSSLAFDTIYAEGGRRYIETFSPYTRQFLDRLDRPDVDVITGIRPALALEQRNRVTSSRSTVGTITEINDYLKIIWSSLGELICKNCNVPVKGDTPDSIFATLVEQATKHSPSFIAITFPLEFSEESTLESLVRTLEAEGFLRFVRPSTNTVEKLEALTAEDFSPTAAHNKKKLLVLADRVTFSLEEAASKDFRSRVLSSLHHAYRFGHDRLEVLFFADAAQGYRIAWHKAFTQDLTCSSCGVVYRKLKPASFSFNSPIGACPECHGFGQILAISPNRCVPNPEFTINEGALQCWATDSRRKELRDLKKFCNEQDISLDTPWKKLTKKQRDLIFNATKKEHGFRGVLAWFKRLERKRYKMHVRVLLSRYREQYNCPTCNGTRLQPEALNVLVNGKTIADIWQLPIERELEYFKELYQKHQGGEIAEIVIAEIISRLHYLCEVGLNYLTLDRQSRTLSGGESQRVNLTSFLGTRLVNTLLVLDEPSIGLHPRDTGRLIAVLRSLRERGNSVLVVEHDTEIIKAAEEIIDLGPKAGAHGGTVVFQGTVDEIRNCAESLTGQYLSKRYLDVLAEGKPKSVTLKKAAKRVHQTGIKLLGCRANNLQNIDIEIPLNELVVITGVSGSGKSTLIQRCLWDNYQKLNSGTTIKELQKDPFATVKDIQGLKLVDEIVLIDQSPVGNTPRSNPATYTKAWDVIRECFAETPQAIQLGLGKNAFSFNVDGGRCNSCNGAGYHRVEMQFLADAFVKCEACDGSRFQDQILNIRFAGKNVQDFLNMTLEETIQVLDSVGESQRAKEARTRLAPLLELGLGYLKLGQPLNELSGGEAQRVKLASYLQPSATKKYLFILDEPTTGLHPHDITKLLETFDHLLGLGHSVLVIEHNLFVIAKADYLIDLGPEGGERGGEIIVQGRPVELLADQSALKRSQTISALIAADKEAQEKLPATTNKKSKPAQKLPSFEAPINIVGARHHNLKNISLQIPKNKLIAVTGVSGSGKSSLAFDIVFAEGQRRYIDCLSPYAKQFINQLQRADVDLVDSIPPTISVSQKTAPPLGISTIGTTTEVYQYLRLLFAKVGTQHCPEHHVPISSFSAELIANEILEHHAGKRVHLLAPAVVGRKGYYTELFNRALKAEIFEAKIDGAIVTLHPELRLERHKLHWISLIVASLTVNSKNSDLLKGAIEQCLVLGGGALEIAIDSKTAEPIVYSTERVCPKCKRGFHELDPQMFSFRSGRGLCNTCGGRGVVGDEGEPVRQCATCGGTRISELGRNVFIDDRNIHEFSKQNAPSLRNDLSKLNFPERLAPVVTPIMTELLSRLKLMEDVGLDYISLDREASSISGGEAQRLRLVRSLGSPLTGVCYVLDEPTIGLHPQDHAQLMSTLTSLRDAGNTVLVVEHDEETIRAADYIIDVGPVGGARGGHIVAQGSLQELLRAGSSLTGQALREREEATRKPLTLPKQKIPGDDSKYLEIVGATANNLKNVTARFPIGQLTVVAGVSGAGKSSLIHQSLVPAVIEEFEGKKSKGKKTHYDRNWKRLLNHESIQRILEIDQAPVGRTPSSTPASYLGVFDDIRKLYAMLPESKAKGWTASHFSFNTAGGRCEACSGRGFVSIPMSFLPEATSLCDVCNGLRYDQETLEIKFQGISIGELLQKTFAEARDIFVNHHKTRRLINYVHQLGLGYLTLGQPTYTLSGGEAQRLKIATELGSREAENTLYILDEPTTGLHMVDVDKLLAVLRELIAKGNTVIVIEHNLDVIRAADYLIELGPGPGDAGGKIVYAGSPWNLARHKTSTPTKQFLADLRSEISAPA